MRATLVKLVRDKVVPVNPDAVARPANSREGRLLALINKGHEELGEIARSPGDSAEYADLLEVLQSLASENGVAWADVEAAQRSKHDRLGGFARGLILVEHKS